MSNLSLAFLEQNTYKEWEKSLSVQNMVIITKEGRKDTVHHFSPENYVNKDTKITNWFQKGRREGRNPFNIKCLKKRNSQRSFFKGI